MMRRLLHRMLTLLHRCEECKGLMVCEGSTISTPEQRERMQALIDRARAQGSLHETPPAWLEQVGD